MRAWESRFCPAQLSGPRPRSDGGLTTSCLSEETTTEYMYTDNSFCTQSSSLLWKLIRSRRLDVAGDRIRRQISSPLALSRVSEHKKPSSGRLGAASPSAGALALHYPPAPKVRYEIPPPETLLPPRRVIEHWVLPWPSSGPVVHGATRVDPLETSSKPARSASSRKGRERRRSQKVGAGGAGA